MTDVEAPPVRRCPACGVAVGVDDGFCRECGTRVAFDTPDGRAPTPAVPSSRLAGAGLALALGIVAIQFVGQAISASMLSAGVTADLDRFQQTYETATAVLVVTGLIGTIAGVFAVVLGVRGAREALALGWRGRGVAIAAIIVGGLLGVYSLLGAGVMLIRFLLLLPLH